MRIKTSNIIFIFLLFIIGLLLFDRCNRPGPEVITKVRVDTLYIRDTLRIIQPKYYIKEIPVNSIDTVIITNRDTIKIDIPISQKVYSDSTYKCYISGYKPNLDSLFIYSNTKIVEKAIYIKDKDNGFYFTPYAGLGYGIFSKKFDLQVGFGIGYKF